MSVKGETVSLYSGQNGHNPQSIQSYSIEETRSGLNRYLILICIAATFGTSVPVGYNIGVVNAVANHTKTWCNQTLIERYDLLLTSGQLETLWATIVSIFLIGGAIGSLGGAWIADRLGRKGSLLTCAILFLSGAVLFQFCRMASSVEMLLIGRLLVGLASGLTTSTAPMYLAEVAPINLRGPLAVLCSMGVTGGVVFGQIFSLEEVFGTEENWHYAFSCFAIMVIVCMLPYPFFRESPKYLYIIAGKREQARKELQLLRDRNYQAIDIEINLMENEAHFQTEKRSLWSVVTDPSLLLPVILVCALQGGQQLSGINAVFYYSVYIFESAGFSSRNAKWANLGAGCVNLLTACFSPLLMAKVNRRPIALWSCFFSGVFLTILTFVVNYIDYFSWLPFACIAAIFAYILSYQMGLGPIPYFIGSELFESGPRPAAMALGSLSSWTCNFIIGMAFPSLLSAWGAFVFMPFAIVCFGLVGLLKVYLPETRGRDPSEVVPLVNSGFQSKPLR